MVNSEYWIYKITSPSNKIYIGQTCNIKRRFQDYKYLQCKRQTKLYNSFKKYGIENHKFDIVCNIFNEFPLSLVTNIEQRTMDAFKAMGYELLNLKDAGPTGKMSKETIIKIKNSLIGRKVSQITRDKISKANKDKKDGQYVIQYLQDGTIREFKSIRKASREFKVSPGLIKRACNGLDTKLREYVLKYKSQ